MSIGRERERESGDAEGAFVLNVTNHAPFSVPFVMLVRVDMYSLYYCRECYQLIHRLIGSRCTKCD